MLLTFRPLLNPSPVPLSRLPCAAYMFHSSAMHERVAKLVCDSIFPLTATKTVLRRNLWVVLDQ